MSSGVRHLKEVTAARQSVSFVSDMLVATLLFSCLCSLDAFSPSTSSGFGARVFHADSLLTQRRSASNVNSLHMAIASSAALLVRKGKMKEVQVLAANMTATGESHAINQFLKDGTRPFGIGKAVDFFNSTASRFQSISVLPEFSKKAKTGFVVELPPPEILGGVLRDAGSRGEDIVWKCFRRTLFSDFKKTRNH